MPGSEVASWSAAMPPLADRRCGETIQSSLVSDHPLQVAVGQHPPRQVGTGPDDAAAASRFISPPRVDVDGGRPRRDRLARLCSRARARRRCRPARSGRGVAAAADALLEDGAGLLLTWLRMGSSSPRSQRWSARAARSATMRSLTPRCAENSAARGWRS